MIIKVKGFIFVQCFVKTGTVFNKQQQCEVEMKE